MAISEIENNKLFPIWPSSIFALNQTLGAWSDFQVHETTLRWFQEELLEILERNNYLINAFPVAHNTGFVVFIDELVCDLTEELQKYR